MKIITERDLIREVASRWADTYHVNQLGSNHKLTKKYEELLRLDLETCTAEDVNKVIGNDAWTNLWCDECEENGKKIVLEFGKDDGYEGNAPTICGECFDKATQLLNNKKASEEA